MAFLGGTSWLDILSVFFEDNEIIFTYRGIQGFAALLPEWLCPVLAGFTQVTASCFGVLLLTASWFLAPVFFPLRIKDSSTLFDKLLINERGNLGDYI